MLGDKGRIGGRLIGRLQSDISGQASVEYLLVGLVLMIIISALAVLGQEVSAGLFVEHASSNASHTIGSATAGVIGDVFLY